jgi:hypothetical protein
MWAFALVGSAVGILTVLQVWIADANSGARLRTVCLACILGAIAAVLPKLASDQFSPAEAFVGYPLIIASIAGGWALLQFGPAVWWARRHPETALSKRWVALFLVNYIVLTPLAACVFGVVGLFAYGMMF